MKSTKYLEELVQSVRACPKCMGIWRRWLAFPSRLYILEIIRAKKGKGWEFHFSITRTCTLRDWEDIKIHEIERGIPEDSEARTNERPEQGR